jgi:hypothetical protein
MKFLKSQIRKFADNICYIQQMWNFFRISDLRAKSFKRFADLKFPQICKYTIFLLTNIGRLLVGSANDGQTFKKRCYILSVLW